jgi:RHS repeat-associated protein
VGGTAGYGWLGAKERSTTTESAGLTLMGDRLYNAVTGRFTSPDPEPGGNPNAYTYPLDPINMFDLDGHWGGWRKAWRWAGRHKMDIAMTAIMFVPGLQGAAWAYRGYRVYRAYRTVRAAQGAGRIARYAAKARHFVRDGNAYLRIGRSHGTGEFRVSWGQTRTHWQRSTGFRRLSTRFHGHVSRRYGGADWHTSRQSRNWTWWKRGQ